MLTKCGGIVRYEDLSDEVKAQLEASDQRWMQLKGVAARRGEVQQPRTIQDAIAVVRDLAPSDDIRDEILREQLAVEALQWSPRAESRWKRSKTDPGRSG